MSRRLRPPLGIEMLEPRLNLAGGILFNAATSTITIDGTSAADVAAVKIQDQGTATVADDKVVVTLQQPVTKGSLISQQFNRYQPGTNLPLNYKVIFRGKEGNDNFTNNSHYQSTAYGGAGDDSLFGGKVADLIYGEYGADYLDGGAGADVIYGGDGNDKLRGGAGSDFLAGQLGDDDLHASASWDLAPASATDVDNLSGAEGHDILFGGPGLDWLYGDAGNDKIDGAGGDDRIYGGTENDKLSGGAGNDLMYGDSGDDSLYGQGGRDTLDGGDGNDGLFGGLGLGSDNLTGGSGADRFLVDSANPDIVRDRTSSDAQILFRNGTTSRAWDGYVYSGASWNDGEIELVDIALAAMHQRIGNTKLLKTSSGADVTVWRFGDGEVGAPNVAWNEGTNVAFTNFVFTNSDLLLQGVFHEFGHFWDDENPMRPEFLAISGWVEWGGLPDYVPGHVPSSADNDWWYLPTATFAELGQSDKHPSEDFATSFAAYFMSALGREYLHGEGASAIPEKMEFMKRFFASLTT